MRSELELAAEGFDGPLARRLLALPVDQPFAFLSRDAPEHAISEFHRGGVDDGRSDACLAGVIARWLNESDADPRRVLVLEEPLGRWSDEAGPASSAAFSFEDRVYYLAAPPIEADEVRRTMRGQSGYPGIGVLSCLDGEIVTGQEASPQALDALARSSVALLVRAWDDEAFMIAPVSSRMTLETLWD